MALKHIESRRRRKVIRKARRIAKMLLRAQKEEYGKVQPTGKESLQLQQEKANA